MKKFFALAVVGFTLLVPGVALASVLGNVKDDNQNYVGRIIVITSIPTPTTHCGEPFLDYKAVIANPGGGQESNPLLSGFHRPQLQNINTND